MTPRQPSQPLPQPAPATPNPAARRFPDCCVVIPVFNQLPYTTGCLDSLRRAGVPDSAIVVVNNGSTDGTREFLDRRPEIKAVHNPANRGCAFAWNQGVNASTATWTVLLNNDVLVPPGALEGLIDCAGEGDFQIVSPALGEGELNYDFARHAADFMRRLARVTRRGVAHGVCFAVHRRVFTAIGLFDDDPRLGGYEDDEFFRRARRAGFRLATTGRSYLHHFGSVTQKSMRAERPDPRAGLGDRAYYREKYGLNWFVRRREQWREGLASAWWRARELRRYGVTLKVQRAGNLVRHF